MTELVILYRDLLLYNDGDDGVMKLKSRVCTIRGCDDKKPKKCIASRCSRKSVISIGQKILKSFAAAMRISVWIFADTRQASLSYHFAFFMVVYGFGDC